MINEKYFQTDYTKSGQLVMKLKPDSIRRRARRHGYREVASYRAHVLSFKHHRKLGCGGWRKKVRIAKDSPRIPSYNFLSVRSCSSRCKLPRERSCDSSEPPHFRAHSACAGRPRLHRTGANSQKSQSSHQQRTSRGKPAVRSL